MTTTPDTNYAALTDAELTRAVAERRGWRDLDPFGYEMMIGNRHHKKVFYEGTDPATGEAHEQVPDYATDPAAALDLLREMDESDTGYDEFCLTTNGDDWEVHSMIYEAHDWDKRRWALAPTPARACCLAWLAWYNNHAAP